MATKLLLVEDVEDLGRSGDVVNVRPGFARNFLLPRGLAIVANRHAMNMQARLQEQRKARAAEDKKQAEAIAGQLKEVSLETIVKVDHEGHMYGSVSTADVMLLLQEQKGIEIEKRGIQLKHPIKETGVHTIPVKLKEGVSASIILKVIPEDPRFQVAEKASAEE
jgi:large subunit ribosomal protein L9